MKLSRSTRHEELVRNSFLESTFTDILDCDHELENYLMNMKLKSVKRTSQVGQPCYAGQSQTKPSLLRKNQHHL